MFGQDPDRTLWERLLQRDADAVADLVQRHSHLLTYIIRGNLGPCSGEDVADVLSQVLFAVWMDIAEYDPRRARFQTWLAMKARFAARGWRRKQESAERFTIPLLDDSAGIYEDTLQRADLTIALAKLSEMDRLIVYLCDLLEHDHETVAAELGITRGALNTRLYRIRRRLRCTLADQLPQRKVRGGIHE